MNEQARFSVPSGSSMNPLGTLRTLAIAASQHAYVPYSNHPRGAALLVSDGSWATGARIESASYSLTVPAIVAAFAAVVAAGRRDVVAAALSDTTRPEDRHYLESAPTGPLRTLEPGIHSNGDPLPPCGRNLTLNTMVPAEFEPAHGIEAARTAACNSLSPHSGFPVGCVLRTRTGRLIAGTNLEHRDWTRTLCAERCAIAAALSQGLTDLSALYVSCPEYAQGTPCGACLQVLAEQAPRAMVWMDRGAAPPEGHPVATLLPAAFNGQILQGSST